MAENIPRISLTLWDSKKEPTECAGLIYSWNGYAEKGSTYSLFRYVEAHGERLRSKYLAWVHDVGEYWIHGKRIIDYLALDDGLSFWWMTLLSEKNPWKSPTINDAVRLFALEEIVEEQKPDLFYLVSSNRGLHEILKDLCKKRGISYKWRCLPDQSSRQLNLRGIYSFLPHPVQALIGLVRHILIRWPLRKAEKVGWFDSKKPLFLCSYFFNIDPDLAEKGHFNTRFWGNLSDLLRKLGFSDTWLEHYYPHKFVSTPQIAIDWVRNFNRKRNEQGFHTFIDTFLSWQIILSVLKRWIKLGRIFWFLDVKRAFRP